MPAPDPGSPSLPVDPRSCSLLGPIALLVQGLMFLLVGGSLVVKRHLEKNKRPWKIWMMDVGKQGIGQMAVHASNLLISDQVASHGKDNPCSLYFLNILIDTTLGVAVIWISLKALTYLFVEVLQKEGFISGDYGYPPKLRYFLKQTSLYLLSLLILKIVVLILFLILLEPLLLPFADWALSWTGSSRSGQEAFVLMGFPLGMNVLQFCLIDSLIKQSTNSPLLPKYHQTPQITSTPFTPSSPTSSSHAPLLSDPATPSARRRQSRQLSASGASATRTLSPIPSSPLLYAKEEEESEGYGSTSLSGTASPALLSRRGSRRRDTDEDDRGPPPEEREGRRGGETESIIQEVSRILSQPPSANSSTGASTFSRPASASGRRRISEEDERGARRSLSREGEPGRWGWEEGVGMEERERG